MKFDIDYIEKVVSILENSALSKLELQDGQQSIKMEKNGATDGDRTRILTLARLSDNQLHYAHTGYFW